MGPSSTIGLFNEMPRLQATGKGVPYLILSSSLSANKARQIRMTHTEWWNQDRAKGPTIGEAQGTRDPSTRILLPC